MSTIFPHPARIAAVLLLVALTGGCDQAKTTPTATPATPPPPQVGLLEITPRDVAVSTELPGRTSPYLIAEVRPQVSGIIKERLFTEGGDVDAGQALYQIDAATYQADYDSARATLARDEANLASAQLKVDRYRNLVKTRAVSQEAFDDATAVLDQAKATLAMDRAALATARINLNYTQVKAPISGTIGRSTVTQGALVTENQATELATIRQIHPLYVDLTQSSTEMLRLKRALASGRLQQGEDASVELILEDGNRYAHAGKLQFSELAVDESTGSVTLRALFPNPDKQLLPGMFVRAVIKEGSREQAILAPQRAVSRNPKGEPTAMVLNAEGIVEQRTLGVERTVGDEWLVSEGLGPGDRLIIDGLQKVRAGSPATPAPTAPAAGAEPSVTPK